MRRCATTSSCSSERARSQRVKLARRCGTVEGTGVDWLTRQLPSFDMQFWAANAIGSLSAPIGGE
jgi:hypothetical protein